MANNRITVHVAGLQAGNVDIDVDSQFLPPLLYDPDADEFAIPDNFCGLFIRKAGGFTWLDGSGQVVEAENNIEDLDTYSLNHPGEPNAYLGGIWFTGPINTCAEGGSWNIPTPLSFGGNGPQFGAERLVIELTGGTEPIEFIDHNSDPIELPDLYDDWDDFPKDWIEELCESNPLPELCGDDDDDPEIAPWIEIPDELIIFDPIVDPPPLGNLNLKALETDAAVALQVLRVSLVHVRALKSLIDGVGSSPICRKHKTTELRAALRYARLVGEVEKNARKLLVDAAREKPYVRERCNRSAFTMYHRMLFYLSVGLRKFRHYALQLESARIDMGNGVAPHLMTEVVEDLERSIELLSEASQRVYMFNRVLWPAENGHRLLSPAVRPSDRAKTYSQRT